MNAARAQFRHCEFSVQQCHAVIFGMRSITCETPAPGSGIPVGVLRKALRKLNSLQNAFLPLEQERKTKVLLGGSVDVVSKRSALARFALNVLTGVGVVCAEHAHAEEAAKPIRASASYVGDAMMVVDGGMRHASALVGKADLVFQADVVDAGLVTLAAYADLQFVHGPALSGELVGVGQAVSGIEAPASPRGYEAWIIVSLKGANLHARVGLIDLNRDFDVQGPGGFFVNSSHGLGPELSQTGLNGPSTFPVTSTALTLAGGQGRWQARFGIFDAVAGDPDHPNRTIVRWPGSKAGLLLIGEVEAPVGRASTIKIGGWRYTKPFATIDGMDQGRSQGAYGILAYDWLLARELRVAAWFRAGLTGGEVNSIGSYLGGGVTFRRGKDQIGLAVAQARLGAPALRSAALSGAGRPDRAETNLELSYRHQFNARIGLQPDIQYISNPGWQSSRRSALVAGIRMHLNFE